MHLKSVTVLGFKSFADKTTLNFQPGVTAIVGPNGCGKSNISDAIRWVLGEQSAKALRGGEMSDVIFNGTDSRKPMGMAEVSLTISGVDEAHLKSCGVELSYNEVTITRRTFRDGGSEYFINRTPCRLRDIQQLFMGTGMGRASYSIMAQGNITQLLSSKPEDRRMVFEEAAGITKFKSQKREALRKLEYTEQNMLRIADLLKEVKRQIISLQRQAGKARRYKQLAAELQHLDTQLARHQYDLLQEEIRKRQAQAQQLQQEIERGAEDLLRLEDELNQLRGSVSELEQQISLSQQRGLELKAQIEQHENRIAFNQERKRELADRKQNTLAAIKEAEERRAAAERELAATAEQLAASEAALAAQRQVLSGQQKAFEELESQIRQKQELLRQKQSEAFAAAQQLSRVRNELNALDLQKQGNVVQLEKLSAEKVQLEEERMRLGERLKEFAASVEDERQNVQSRRGSIEERQERLRQLQQELNSVGHELDAVMRQQAELRTQFNMLQQLENAYEGFEAGALAALRQSNLVLGPFSARIRVPDEYVTAVEAALGRNLQLVLTEQPEAAHQILSELRQSGKGKASIAPLAFHSGNGEPAAAEGGNGNGGNGQTPPGVALAGVVEADETVLPLVKRLLGRTRLMPDLASATAAWRECGGAWDFVTPSGDLLSCHGIFTGGGNGASKGPSSILGRKNQIAELGDALEQTQKKLDEISRKKGALQAEQTSLQANLQQAQQELRAQEVAIATHQGEYKALESSHRLLGQKIETVVYEIQSLAAREEEGRQKRAVLSGQISELEQREQELAKVVSELSASLEDLRQQREVAAAALTESRVALAAEEQRRHSQARQQEQLKARISEIDALLETQRADLSSFDGRNAQADAEIEASSRQIDRLRAEREQVSQQTADLLARKDGLQTDVLAREDALRNTRREHDERVQQRGAIEVELAQKNMSVQNLCERIQQKYQVRLDDVRSECITITYAEEGPARIEVMTPEEMSAAGVATDWDAVASQVNALQQKLDEMGPVNLVAIEEYEETEQRYKFLSTQYEDLTKAKEQLVELINRINSQTKEMFISTFNQIRTNFQQMFVEVFGGGKADLYLADEGDVLESGIEIVARPPGKQLQSISLLSGGEQTMTAVALLFSIYQVKPSPFCLLDEMDAALDEANINRFLKILKRFLQQSQFIIITHNKRTIGMADALYGVTMQEQGVSKVVSVKFRKESQPPELQTTHELEKPMAAPEINKAEDIEKPKSETMDVAMAK